MAYSFERVSCLNIWKEDCEDEASRNREIGGRYGPLAPDMKKGLIPPVKKMITLASHSCLKEQAAKPAEKEGLFACPRWSEWERGQ